MGKIISLLKKCLFHILIAIRRNKILVVIFFLGLILRFWGIKPGYHLFHQEEPLIYFRALMTILGRQHEMIYFGYPALVSLVHAIFYLIFFLPLSFITNFISHLDIILSTGLNFPAFFKDYIVGAREINVLYWGRYTSAFLGSVSILLTYLIGKKYFNKSVGLYAALFLAVNYRHILSSHFALVDVPNDLFFLLVFFPTWQILRRVKIKDYILAGITAGLSMSVKLSPFVLVVPLVAHFFNHLKNRKLFNFSFLFLVLIIIFFFMLTTIAVNIFHVLNFYTITRDSDALVPRYQVGQISLRPYAYFYLFQYGLGPVLSFLFIIGTAHGLKKYFQKTVLVLLLILLFFFFLTIYSRGGLYVRNFVGIFPLIFIFSALGVEFLTEKFLKKYRALGKLLLSVIIIGGITPSLINSITLDNSYSQDWNFTKAANYLKTGFDSTTIASQPIIANLVFPKNINRVIYSTETNYSLPELQDVGADYVLIDSDSASSALMWWMSEKGLELFDKDPNNFAYSTFAGGSLKELFMYQTIGFSKPWQAPEANLFLIRIPSKEKLNFDSILYQENFDLPVDWRVKGLQGVLSSDIGQVFSNQCFDDSCVRIGPLYFKNKQIFRVIRFTSLPIQMSQGFLYKASVKIKSSIQIDLQGRDGFFKVELFGDRQSSESEKSGNYIFTSSRFFGEADQWQEKEIVFPLPLGMKYATVSFQTSGVENKEMYFDDLKIEKVKIEDDLFGGLKIDNLNPKKLPEDLIFINSIL